MAFRHFTIEFARAIKNMNVKVSGFAKVVGLESCLYSVSLIVEGDGLIPIPSVDRLADVQHIFRALSVEGFEYFSTQYIYAEMNSVPLERWQIQFQEKM